MANTFITNTARFRPFSFQEMLQPYQIYTDVYNTTEEELANLDIMAGDVASKLNNPLDAELKNQYQGFKEELNTAMNDLYDKGLTPDTRKKLAGLKARYTKDLNPINEAYKNYSEDEKYYRQLSIQHPELLIERDNVSIKDYMHGNIPTTITANTEDIYNKSKQEAAGASSRFSEMLKPEGILGNQYYQFITKQGITQDSVDELNRYLSNPENIKSEQGRALYAIIEKQRAKAGYNNFSKEGRDTIDASILNGIFAGASYKEDVDRVSNKNWTATPIPPGDETPPPPTNTNLFFRSIPRVTVDKNGVSTTRANESIKFLQQVLDNPDILNVKESHNVEPSLEAYYPYVRGTEYDVYPNLQKLSNIAKTYGLGIDVNNIESLTAGIQALQSKISEAAQLENDFVLSVTDDKLIKTVVSQNIASYNVRTGNSGMREIVNGRVKNKEIENTAEFFDGNVHITYSPGLGIVMTSTKDNKTKSAVVDPYLIDGSGMVNSFINSIESNIKNGNYEEAKMLIQGSDSYTGLMEFLYNTFNTIPMVQGTSTTKPINP